MSSNKTLPLFASEEIKVSMVREALARLRRKRDRQANTLEITEAEIAMYESALKQYEDAIAAETNAAAKTDTRK